MSELTITLTESQFRNPAQLIALLFAANFKPESFAWLGLVGHNRPIFDSGKPNKTELKSANTWWIDWYATWLSKDSTRSKFLGHGESTPAVQATPAVSLSVESLGQSLFESFALDSKFIPAIIAGLKRETQSQGMNECTGYASNRIMKGKTTPAVQNKALKKAFVQCWKQRVAILAALDHPADTTPAVQATPATPTMADIQAMIQQAVLAALTPATPATPATPPTQASRNRKTIKQTIEPMSKESI
jgi:hypothetical protein